MTKKIKFLIISLVLFLGFITNTNAKTIDLTEKGSIEITLKESSDMISGAEITLYHIADAKVVNNNLAFSLKDELSNCNVNLDDFTDKSLVDNISNCNLNDTKKYVRTTNKNGVVKFDNLDLGLYLVVETKGVQGYSNIDSFLVAVPKVEDNVWTTNVKAKPKTEIYKVIDLVVEKKWNSNSKDIPKEVTIELYNDDILVDTVKLNESNNWTYTWKNIKLSDKYMVKEINIPKGYTPSYKVDGYLFTVTNTDTLASTGQIFYPIIIFSVLGIMSILIGIRMIKNEA